MKVRFSQYILSLTLLLVNFQSFAGDNTLTEPASYSLVREQARADNIAIRSMEFASGAQSGYYVVTGVFGDKGNASKMLSTLKPLNLGSGILASPDKDLNYVYLGFYKDGLTALDNGRTAFGGTYRNEFWILHVAGTEKPFSNARKTDVRKVSHSTKGKLKNKQGKVNPVSRNNLHNSQMEEATELILRQAKADKIAFRSMEAIEGTRAGYYAIAGVFGDKANAVNMLNTLHALGLDAGILLPGEEKGLHYVYLGYFEDGLKALKSGRKAFGGAYSREFWILHLKGKEDFIARASTLQQAAGKLPPLKTKLVNSPVTQTNFKDSIDPEPSHKLLQKADSYFHKMWYAEAAELYEYLLGKEPQFQTFRIIEKAADAHYYNTNMDRAFYWYDQLYRDYRDEMSSENIFKYAHSLKGTGKYGRARRLMRLYHKKYDDKTLATQHRVQRPDEAMLETILSKPAEYEVRNLAVNTKYSEFAPMFHNSDEVVYSSSMDSSFLTTRRYKWNNQPYLDLYVAKFNEESQEVREAVKFSKRINSKYHEAAVTFSPDNSIMYFTRNNYKKKLRRDQKGINHLKIYRSVKTDGEWGEPLEVPFNSDEYSTGHPALSPDGQQLYFVSDMPGTIGGTDIFVVDVYGDNTYSEPRNLGPEINTERKEMFPFINDKKLYFSSDGHAGLGGLDIFEVGFEDEQGFLEVRNLGAPVNSNKDDFSYIVNEQTQKGFFASNRRGGKGDDDLYSFHKLLPEETNENAIAGVVTELVSGEVIPDAMVSLLDENRIKLKEVTAAADGSFVFEDLDSDRKYFIQTVKADYFELEQEVATVDNQKVDVTLSLKKLEELIVIEEGIKKLKTDMIFFDFDKFSIRKDAALALDKLVSVMKEYPKMVIKIESHTDSRGKRAYNKYLSDKRAKSSMEYLISQGIAPERILSATGYGEERLLNNCDGSIRCKATDHQKNRRSEFIIVSM